MVVVNVDLAERGSQRREARLDTVIAVRLDQRIAQVVLFVRGSAVRTRSEAHVDVVFTERRQHDRRDVGVGDLLHELHAEHTGLEGLGRGLVPDFVGLVVRSPDANTQVVAAGTEVRSWQFEQRVDLGLSAVNFCQQGAGHNFGSTWLTDDWHDHNATTQTINRRQRVNVRLRDLAVVVEARQAFLYSRDFVTDDFQTDDQTGLLGVRRNQTLNEETVAGREQGLCQQRLEVEELATSSQRLRTEHGIEVAVLVTEKNGLVGTGFTPQTQQRSMLRVGDRCPRRSPTGLVVDAAVNDPRRRVDRCHLLSPRRAWCTVTRCYER
ncbi:hypothetical protein D3C72_1167570 [compost metagenome]